MIYAISGYLLSVIAAWLHGAHTAAKYQKEEYEKIKNDLLK